MPRALAAIPTLALAASLATGQLQDINRPATASRIVAHFDFEPNFENPTDLPLGWVRAQEDPAVPRVRPGFPAWNLARMDTAAAAQGERGLTIPTRGGSTSLLLNPGVISIFPNADYAVTALLRTTGLDHAAAQLEARLLDQDGNPIPGTNVQSPLVRGEDWTRVVLSVEGTSDAAAFLQIECLLLQPKTIAATRGMTTRLPDEFVITKEDFDGAAHLDDIVVIQAPRVRLGSTAPGHLFEAPKTPEITVLVRDLAGVPLEVDAKIYDIDGRVVQNLGDAFQGGRLETTMTPDLPALGWYRAAITVQSQGELIGADSLDFGWLPPRPAALLPALGSGQGTTSGSPDRRRFGAIISEIPGQSLDAALAELDPLLMRLGMGDVGLPVFDNTLRLDEARQRAETFVPFIDSLRRHETYVTLALTELPDPLTVAAAVVPADVAALFTLDEQTWHPWLRPILDVLGQRVDQWQVGPIGFDPTLAPSTPDLIAEIENHFSALVPGPAVRTATRADLRVTPELARPPRGVTLTLPPGADDTAIEILAERWNTLTNQTAGPGLTSEPALITYALSENDTPEEPLHMSLAAMARRAALAWYRSIPANAPAQAPPEAVLAVIDPVTWHRGKPMPTASGVMWRSLMERLAGRRAAADLDLAPGVRALVFEPIDERRDSLMVVWQTEIRDPNTPLHVRLAQRAVTVFDEFGNSAPLNPVPIGTSGALVHEFPVSPIPLFIEGVDVPLLKFQASIRLKPPELLSRSNTLEHDLVFDNPWPNTIRGEFFIVEPGGKPEERRDSGWQITPRFGSFAMAPRATTSIPLSFNISPAVQTGPQQFIYEFDVGGETDFGLIRVERTVKLGLPNVRLDIAYRYSDAGRGDDLLLEARVTNIGTEPIDIDLVARVPGFARESRSINGIAEGETITRVFPFQGGRQSSAGQRAAVAVLLPENGGRLTKSLEITADGNTPPGP
ncbi:MAG: hypothetical protein AAGI17_07490 [Planctomycetota bacterium]